MQLKKPFLVLVILVIASMACYSDNPLWLPGLTEVPPSPTFLPTPDEDTHPSRFSKNELALAPEPQNPEQPFFFITELPEDLLSGVRNASGSCEYGSSLEILYIGHEFNSFRGSVYVDDLSLIAAPAEGEEPTGQPLFDFESEDDAWTLVQTEDSLNAGQEVQRAQNVDFNELRAEPAEGEEPIDATNTTGVLEITTDFQPGTWLATIQTSFDTPQDWSQYSTLSARVFVPRNARNFVIFLKANTTSGQEVTLVREIVDSGQWADITADLAAVEDLTEVSGITVNLGPDPARTFYLVACSGNVGWATGERLAGPVRFERGQSALTRPVGARGEPLREGQPFMVSTDPNPALPPTTMCDVDQVVDVVDISAVEERTGEQTIWYQINCAQNRGWVTEDRIFGPLILPAQDGLGIVKPELAPVELTAEPRVSGDDNQVLGTCEANQTLTTSGFTTISIGEPEAEGDTPQQLTPYYRIQCGDYIGWTEQTPLLEIPYPVGTNAMVVGDEELGQVETEAEADEEDAEVTEGEEAAADADEIERARGYLPVPLTEVPEVAVEGNIIGECPSGTVVELQNVNSSNDRIFYQVTCGESTGWIEDIFLPNGTDFILGNSIWFMEPSTAGREAQEGYELLQTTSKVSEAAGQCALFTEATVSDAVFQAKALRRLGFRIWYEITCTDIDGEETSGWLEADDLQEVVSRRNPFHLLGG
ncbi:MAG: hypothetical protein GYB66_06395 [Chloroflexi bacterium]|nr:hypothetical protein [Chloroflexota bacterium]